MKSNHAGNIDRPIPLCDHGVLHRLIGVGFDMLALGPFFRVFRVGIVGA